MQRVGIGGKFYSPIIRMVVALIVAGIIWLVALHLPMLEAIPVGNLPPSEDIIGTIFILIMAAIVLNFAREFGRELRMALPQFPESSTICKSLIYTIVVVMVYYALRPWVRFVPEEKVWIYQLVFLLLTVAFLGVGGLALYRSVDKVTPMFGGLRGKEASSPSKKMVTCPKCGALNDPDAKFCTSCGARLVAPEKPKVVICPKCGAENPPNARFCTKCGAELVTPGE